MNKTKLITFLVSTFLLLMFHIVGAFAMIKTNQYLDFVGFNFIFITILIIINHDSQKRQLMIFLILISLFMFIVECFGVATGMLFGNYYYRGNLGTRLFNVPVFIGLFYFVLVYSYGVIISNLFHKVSSFYKKKRMTPSTFLILFSLITSFLITLTDFLFIEKVAHKLGWWIWVGMDQKVPWNNYVTWFVVCFILALIYQSFSFSRKNYLAWSFVVSILSFFTIVLYL